MFNINNAIKEVVIKLASSQSINLDDYRLKISISNANDKSKFSRRYYSMLKNVAVKEHTEDEVFSKSSVLNTFGRMFIDDLLDFMKSDFERNGYKTIPDSFDIKIAIRNNDDLRTYVFSNGKLLFEFEF